MLFESDQRNQLQKLTLKKKPTEIKIREKTKFSRKCYKERKKKVFESSEKKIDFHEVSVSESSPNL